MPQKDRSRIDEILRFWFGTDWDAEFESRTRIWFTRDPSFDRRCAESFLADHEAAAAGALENWTATPRGALGLIILLDQIPRNIFRDSPRAYATDAVALAIARRTVDSGMDGALAPSARLFVYLPFEHSENVDDQRESVRRTRAVIAEYPAAATFLPYAKEHLAVIQRFGRFPHRNAILARLSTPEEIAFLQGQAASS